MGFFRKTAIKTFSWIITIGFIAMFGSFVFAAQEEEQPKEKVTTPQPLYTGTRIFEKSDPVVGYQAYYTYLGYEGGRLRIKYELYYHYDELVESEILTLPIGTGSETILSTRPFGKEVHGTASKLKITVLDSFGGLKVERMKK